MSDELRLRVADTQQVAQDVRVVDLVADDGSPLPPWSAGAHLDLHLPTAQGALVRQYSLCGDVADRAHYRVAVLREPHGRGGSSHVHDALHEGDVVRTSPPRNNFALEPSPRYVFLAGGIGITPMVPMLAAADAAGAQWTLHYGGRTAAGMAFAQDLRERYGEQVQLYPQDETGLLPLAELIGTPQPDTLVYCCGSAPLLDAVSELCTTWPGSTLHIERFTPIVIENHGVDDGFEVELATSGQIINVPADRSVLESLRAAGVDLLSSCEEGTCGTCETGVLAGTVEHRDSLLTLAERAVHDVMYPCVSRAAAGCGRLVLDR